jgi:hypothetical protein
MKKSLALLGIAGALAISAPAFAANYNFDVLYSGGGNASLAAGSDDPLATNLQVGDTFTYDLKAVSGGYWTVFNGGDLFPFFALALSDSGERTGNYALTLSRNGSTTLSDSKSGVWNAWVHLGTDTVSLPTGLTFDDIQMNYTFLTSTVANAKPWSILPWGGVAPEEQFSGNISYDTVSQPVPEPETYAMLMAGLGLLGAVARRRKNQGQ